jgi:hypothetical protein
LPVASASTTTQREPVDPAPSREGYSTLRWATRYPEKVPLVNGEFEWIACNMADID